MKSFFCVCVVCILFLNTAAASVIMKTKRNRALIRLEGVSSEMGDKFNVLNTYGRTMGILEIKRIKGDRALGVLLKGKMKKGSVLEPRSARSAESTPREDEEDEDYNYNNTSSGRNTSQIPIRPTTGIGFLAGLHLNSVRVSEDKIIFGPGAEWGLNLDFRLSSLLHVRLSGSFYMLRTKGLACPSNIRICALDIDYPKGTAILRGFLLTDANINLWIGAGASILYPLPKENRLNLQEESFQYVHWSPVGALGIDYHFGEFYVPIQLELNWINPFIISFKSQGKTNDLKPFFMGIKLGMVFSF